MSCQLKKRGILLSLITVCYKYSADSTTFSTLFIFASRAISSSSNCFFRSLFGELTKFTGHKVKSGNQLKLNLKEMSKKKREFNIAELKKKLLNLSSCTW